MIQANKATVSTRGWLTANEPVFSATAILRTKVAEIEMNSGAVFDVDNAQIFTESNLGVELEKICLFILAEYEMAQATARGGE